MDERPPNTTRSDFCRWVRAKRRAGVARLTEALHWIAARSMRL